MTIEELKDCVLVKKKQKNKISLIKNQNCYTYALNIQLPGYINLGDLSNLYDKHYHFSSFRNIFEADCKTLDLDILEVTPDYELEDNNEWLVALFGTDYYFSKNNPIDVEFCDFHFLKKNYGEIWSQKYTNDIITYLDTTCNKITDPETADIYTCDRYGNKVNYNYLGTYRLRKNEENKKFKFSKYKVKSLTKKITGNKLI